MSKKKGKKTRIPGVRRLDPGRYRIRLRWTDPKTGKERDTTRDVAARSAAEAVARREELLEELLKPGTPKALTVADYARRWLISKLPALRPSTRRLYAGYLDNHILPVMGTWNIDAITRWDVVQWRDAQHGAPASINGRLRVLKTMMRDAVVDLGLGQDPTARVRRVSEAESKSKVLAADELGRFLSALSLDPYKSGIPVYPITLTLAYTGGRWGTVTALRWTDIDYDTKSIRFSRAHWHGRVSGTKTGTVRTVPLSDELAHALRMHRKHMLAQQHAALETGYVFTTPSGTLVTPDRVRQAYLEASIAAKIGRRVTPHFMRHTFNDLLRRVTSGTVQRSISGHSTVQMSEHYSEVDLGEKHEALRGVLALVNGV